MGHPNPLFVLDHCSPCLFGHCPAWFQHLSAQRGSVKPAEPSGDTPDVMGEAAEGAEGEAAEGADAVRIHMVPPCRLIVRATAGARVIGKQGVLVRPLI